MHLGKKMNLVGLFGCFLEVLWENGKSDVQMIGLLCSEPVCNPAGGGFIMLMIYDE